MYIVHEGVEQYLFSSRYRRLHLNTFVFLNSSSFIFLNICHLDIYWSCLVKEMSAFVLMLTYYCDSFFTGLLLKMRIFQYRMQHRCARGHIMFFRPAAADIVVFCTYLHRTHMVVHDLHSTSSRKTISHGTSSAPMTSARWCSWQKSVPHVGCWRQLALVLICSFSWLRAHYNQV